MWGRCQAPLSVGLTVQWYVPAHPTTRLVCSCGIHHPASFLSVGAQHSSFLRHHPARWLPCAGFSCSAACVPPPSHVFQWFADKQAARSTKVKASLFMVCECYAADLGEESDLPEEVQSIMERAWRAVMAAATRAMWRWQSGSAMGRTMGRTMRRTMGKTSRAVALTEVAGSSGCEAAATGVPRLRAADCPVFSSYSYFRGAVRFSFPCLTSPCSVVNVCLWRRGVLPQARNGLINQTDMTSQRNGAA